MNKKIFRLISAVLTAVTLISAAAIPSMAAAPDLTVKVDGKVIDFPDQEPTIVKDRTLVPVRFIAENLGYDVEWDKDANAAVIDNGRIVLYIGTDQAKIDGKTVTLDVAS
ncbi:MAG: copper amine oxidase N-terminal domain-containing protein, partial [Lachnospiraceae bacterium]|nr:copper amine oxidase N-terminal domain-containing protein [Lachnospiraceae bacterium]